MKKKHWTQTPEGKRKMSLRMKKSWKAKRKEPTNGGSEEAKVLYVLGRVEGFITAFAEGSSISSRLLTERVGELLLAKTRRQVLGIKD